ncbi:NAD-dependent epimerase/dehydratase family protein [Vibrio europaeus]|uniref:NAD-dependent epimerase/dehydratase family protein n=1 Tax=Vibrio europaeus TaxID=300876 RepID=UPI00148E7791|nr:NAD-dependent epimerase/dehydratase family protein [Vibrio europaeus]MDC5837971.1 NAD-dependent epimerase/dehydratase family protein [Vibrio europaeus]NOH22777.1 NAD-dependent epimerase/dehydratase family protein [Vibrio europaeus]
MASMLNNKYKILVTGAYGFIGSALVERVEKQWGVESLTLAVRHVHKHRRDLNTFSLGTFNSETDWSKALNDCNVVIHSAGRAHFKKQNRNEDYSESLLEDYHSSMQLANSAVRAGVERFIFISSVLAQGSMSITPFKECDIPTPDTPAGKVKLEIEKGLLEIGEKSGMEIVIIRSSLVYGRNAPGNFGHLVSLLERQVPLPLGLVKNKRSLIGIDNLVDLVMICIVHQKAANQIINAADGEDLSTTELLTSIASAMGKKCYLVPVPSTLIRCAALLIGKKNQVDKLISSLQVDISKARDELGWVPRFSIKSGLGKCFIASKENEIKSDNTKKREQL